jgi:hypothetical protein
VLLPSVGCLNGLADPDHYYIGIPQNLLVHGETNDYHPGHFYMLPNVNPVVAEEMIDGMEGKLQLWMVHKGWV